MVGAALTGCRTHLPKVKPPLAIEEYNLPAETDERFSRPIQFPKESMNNPRKRLIPGNATDQLGGPGSRFGTGPGGIGAPRGGGF
jgi:hypothetical protein